MSTQSPEVYPVVLSGGSGTRLWPLSRALYPKQLMPLVGEDSLLQATLTRTGQNQGFAAPIVICNDEHRFLVAEQLRQSGIESAEILLEPIGRNTAPAACVAAQILAKKDPEAILLLLPSDHHIADTTGFHRAVDQAAAAAARGALVTFGIKPDRPETGYGYIQQADASAELENCYQVARFVEKPDLETAEGYLAAGDYAWNSGMFVFRADRLIEEMQRFEPEIVAACQEALDKAESDLSFLRLDRDAFANSPSISIDYAVMERTDRAAVVPVDIGWTDVGSWNALWAVSPQDDAGNSLHGDVLSVDCRNCFLHSEQRLVAGVGLDDVVVVETADAVLVSQRGRSQEVKRIVEELAKAERSEHQHHTRVYRPWGSYQTIDADEGFQAKRLIINPGASISLQKHNHRAEHWVVVRGLAEVTRDDEVFQLEVNQSTYIPLGAVHRLRNPGAEPLYIVEVQSGGYLGEDDIERFEDHYGRS